MSASYHSYSVGVTKIQCYDVTIDGKEISKQHMSCNGKWMEHPIGSKTAKTAAGMKAVDVEIDTALKSVTDHGFQQ